MENLIEIEADAPQNANVRVRPLQANVRGRWDWSRCSPELHRHAAKWGGLPIPGQRIQLNPETGIAAVIDPLHEPEHDALREKVKAAGYALPPRRTEHEGIDGNTWLHWMKRMVDAGFARLTKGRFPDGIDAAKARKNFIVDERKGPSRDDLLVTALTKQADAFDRLASAIEKLATRK